MKIRYPLSLRQVEDLLFERGIDICHETLRLWWNRFGPMFAVALATWPENVPPPGAKIVISVMLSSFQKRKPFRD